MVCYIAIQIVVFFFTTATQVLAIYRIAPAPVPQNISTETSTSPNDSNTTATPPINAIDYPVECFNPYLPDLKSAAVEDCRIVIEHILSSYGDPWLFKTWGYTEDVDINLDIRENSRWKTGRCAIFVKNIDQSCVGRFRMVDVARAANRILEKCVIGLRYPYGGTAQVGFSLRTSTSRFYVALGGLSGDDRGNGTIIALPASG